MSEKAKNQNETYRDPNHSSFQMLVGTLLVLALLLAAFLWIEKNYETNTKIGKEEKAVIQDLYQEKERLEMEIEKYEETDL